MLLVARVAAFLGIVTLALSPAESSVAQDKPLYNPLETFAPLTLPGPINRYRSANGAPGPDYWQNRADYEIHATLDPEGKRLTGQVTIAYTNNSPDALDSLWLQLDQNIYRKDARSVLASGWPRDHFTDGFLIDELEVDRGGKVEASTYLV